MTTTRLIQRSALKERVSKDGRPPKGLAEFAILHPWLKAANRPWKKSSAAKFVLGRERFAKISAVEGVALTPTMKKRAEDFDRLGLIPDERRREILKVYRDKA